MSGLSAFGLGLRTLFVPRPFRNWCKKLLIKSRTDVIVMARTVTNSLLYTLQAYRIVCIRVHRDVSETKFHPESFLTPPPSPGPHPHIRPLVPVPWRLYSPYFILRPSFPTEVVHSGSEIACFKTFFFLSLSCFTRADGEFLFERSGVAIVSG